MFFENFRRLYIYSKILYESDKVRFLFNSLTENARCELQSLPLYQENFACIKENLVLLYKVKSTKGKAMINVLNPQTKRTKFKRISD